MTTLVAIRKKFHKPPNHDGNSEEQWGKEEPDNDQKAPTDFTVFSFGMSCLMHGMRPPLVTHFINSLISLNVVVKQATAVSTCLTYQENSKIEAAFILCSHSACKYLLFFAAERPPSPGGGSKVSISNPLATATPVHGMVRRICRVTYCTGMLPLGVFLRPDQAVTQTVDLPIPPTH